MSQPSLANNSANTGASTPQKQKFSVYTMMLILSFIALLTGSLLLAHELLQYGPYPQWNTPPDLRTTGAGS